MEEKKKQICLRLTEEEKTIIEEKAKTEGLTVNAFILKRLLNDSNEIENAINKLSDEIEVLKSENVELRQLAIEERKSCNEVLKDVRSYYEGIVLGLNEKLKSNQILIESKENKKSFWARIFKK